MLLVGCSATTDPEAHTSDMHTKNLTQKKVHKMIKKAAEENGWKMTEFKVNSMIAEKIGTDLSSTVTYGKDYFDVTPPNSELTSILEDAF